MSPRFEIIEAKTRHCGQITRRLRAEHTLALSRTGARTHDELRQCFMDSATRRAWLIDGELSALGGVTGPLMSPYGYVWLAISEKARRYPIQIIQTARAQLSEIMLTKQ